MRSNPSTAVVCQPLLSAHECEQILTSLDGETWNEARVALPDGYGVDSELRTCALAEVNDAALLARVESWILELNRNYYQFELRGFDAKDPVTAMRYRSGDHFDWHIDNGTEAVATRKLSFTLLLGREFQGGELEFAMYRGHSPGVLARGSILVFPSFHLHRVSAVTSGERVALVGWIHGPRFR